MQIVIEIPGNDYQVTLTKIMIACYGCKITELPKGHGDLIDAECVKKQFNGKEGDDFTAFHFYDAVDNAPRIIPADKDGENRDGMELL